ncbi:MAG: PIN domain-containing protein [Burkholderiales bacterium]|nr:PIN domain-containing protein [Burkholderiales bacterium]
MAVAFVGNLPAGARITVDSAPIIYMLEDHPKLAAHFAPVFDAAARGELSIMVSTITLAEVMAGPLRAGNEILAAQYHEAMRGSRNWEIVPVTQEIAVLAARIRVARRLRLPDAIQVATAVATGSAALVTHDVDLSKVREIRIIS